MGNMPPNSATAIQDIAVSFAFVVMGEPRYNRTLDEYAAIAKKFPPLKELTFRINGLLEELHRCSGCAGEQLPQICRFKGGDQYILYEDYPRHISYETVRNGLTKAGMRCPQKDRPRSL